MALCDWLTRVSITGSNQWSAGDMADEAGSTPMDFPSEGYD